MIPETVKQLPEGDRGQVTALRQLYSYYLEQKDHLVLRASSMNLTPLLLAEINLQLATLTAKLKHIDAQVHYLTFGGQLQPELPALQMEQHLAQLATRTRQLTVLQKKLYQLQLDNQRLRTDAAAARRSLEWYKWGIKNESND